MSVASFEYLSHSEGCFFILFMISFVQKILSFIRSHLFIFVFYFHYSRIWGKKDLAVIYVGECSVFSFKSFIVSGLTFRSLIHFEFISVYGVKKCSNFIFFVFYMELSSFPSTTYGIDCLFSLYIVASFVRDKVTIGA